jgi:hypothetical protein
MPGLLTDEMLDAFTVQAAPDGVGVALKERYEGLMDRVALYGPSWQANGTTSGARSYRQRTRPGRLPYGFRTILMAPSRFSWKISYP